MPADANAQILMRDRLIEHAMISRGLSYFRIADHDLLETWSVYIGQEFAGYIFRNTDGHWRGPKISGIALHDLHALWVNSRFEAALRLESVSSMRCRLELQCPPPK